MKLICFRIQLFLCLILFVTGAGTTAEGSMKGPQIVSFQSAEKTLQGYLWVPEGDGPFRAVVWSYGQKQRLLDQEGTLQFAALAKFYVQNKYVLFIPDRSSNEDERTKTKNKEAKFFEVSTATSNDLIAAISWLRQQSFVNAGNVAVSGIMNGSLQSLLAVERDATLRAAIIFSPGSFNWETRPELRALLQRSIKNAEVPIFLIQPQNDNTLQPSETLGRLLSDKGGLNRTKIYPPFDGGDARMFSMEAVGTWGPDVLKFLDSAMKR